MEQEKNFQLGDLIRKVWFLIKKNWILITAIVLVFVLGGVGYSYIRKPTYTSSRSAFYNSKLDSSIENLYDYTITVNMMDTFIDFCDEPVVLKRANYYYQEYLKYKEANPKKSVTDYVTKVDKDKQDKCFGGNAVGVPEYFPSVDENGFIYSDAKSTENSNEIIKVYEGKPVLDEYEELIEVGATPYDFQTYIKAEDVKITATKVGETDAPSFEIKVSCSDKDSGKASAKVEILILAIKHEASKPTKVQKVETYNAETYNKVNQDQNTPISVKYIIDYKYFEAKIDLGDFGNIGFATDMSKSKIITMTVIIGVVFAGLAVAVIYLMDRTVRSKEELEEIAGCNVIAVISMVGEDK